MGTGNISGIGKVFTQGQILNAQGQVQDDNIKVAFTEVMGQMSAMVGSGVGSEQQDMCFKQNAVNTSGVSDREYDRYQRQEMSIQSSSKKDWSESGQVSEKMEQFAKDVKDVLKDELGVSEEQIEKAMETLGLSYADLMNPQQLATLVMELTGADSTSALLCNSEFLTVLQSVGTITENLLKELGVTAEELTQALEEVQNMAEELTKQDVDVESSIGISADSEVLSADKASADENLAVSEALVNTDAKEVDTSEISADSSAADAVVSEDDSVHEPDAEAELMQDDETDEKTDNGASKNQTAFSDSAAPKNLNTQTGAAAFNQQVSDTVFTQAQDSVNGFSSQIDVANIMKQIVEYSKVTLANSSTTMEMQLNPENLGKLYLEITSKNGVVSAHITAQNEAVKEVLESQVVELRQNMNQAGIKVEAVEVTVGSHEFEKNLEQNAKQEEKQAEEQEKVAKQTRRINLNELDELSGMMSEEENLVAQMMADQGNSVDFTA